MPFDINTIFCSALLVMLFCFVYCSWFIVLIFFFWTLVMLGFGCSFLCTSLSLCFFVFIGADFILFFWFYVMFVGALCDFFVVFFIFFCFIFFGLLGACLHSVDIIWCLFILFYFALNIVKYLFFGVSIAIYFICTNVAVFFGFNMLLLLFFIVGFRFVLVFYVLY